MEHEYVERRRDHPFSEQTDSEHQASRSMNSSDVRHKDSSNERRRDHEYRDRVQRVSPEKGQEMEMSRRMRLDDSRRIDLHRGNGPSYPVANALLSPQMERHPERLMQSHGQLVSKDVDKFGKYQRKSVGTGHRSDRHASPEGNYYADDQLNQRNVDPNSVSAAARHAARMHRRGEVMSRNDSLASDLSDCVRPVNVKPKKPRKGNKHSSMSSSDDELPTTPEGTSWEDQEFINDKGNFCFYYVGY